MTTRLRLLKAPDLFVDNEVYCLRREAGEPDLNLAGMAWIMEREPIAAAHQQALKHATSVVLSKLAGYTLWLLAGHTCWQENTRVTRYRKLWGSFRTSGLEIPLGRDMGESFIETSEGLRYFGAMELGLSSLDAALAILEREPISHLVALSSEHSTVVGNLVQGGWDLLGAGPSAKVLGAVCYSEGVVFWPVGAFDDVEAGAIALGTPAIIDRCLA